MAYLVDSSILLRLANTQDAQYDLTKAAVRTLHRAGETLNISPQNVIEFRNVATRPAADNGLGFVPLLVEQKIVAFETLFPLLVETKDIYPAWKSIVEATGVIGKTVHDARLVAICHVHSVTHILTFNVRHFTRFAIVSPGITVVDTTSV